MFYYIMDVNRNRIFRKSIERVYDKGKYNKSGIYFGHP